MILLYAVVPADTSVPEKRGLAGQPLEIIRGKHAAVVVEESSERVSATGDASRVFGEIICDMATVTTLLPIRFPTMLPTRTAVLSELQTNEAAWRGRLTALNGLSEVVIRAQWPAADQEVDSASRSSGTTYLMNRAAGIHRLEASVAEISATVRPWAREIKVLPSQQGVRIACLVPHADVPRLKSAVSSWQQSGKDRQAVASGPWPVFSFAIDQEAGSR